MVLGPLLQRRAHCPVSRLRLLQHLCHLGDAHRMDVLTSKACEDRGLWPDCYHRRCHIHATRHRCRAHGRTNRKYIYLCRVGRMRSLRRSFLYFQRASSGITSNHAAGPYAELLLLLALCHPEQDIRIRNRSVLLRLGLGMLWLPQP